MSDAFDLACASIIGRDHVLAAKNCQDAFATQDAYVETSRVTIGVVCDGCGSGPYSEVGARLGAAMLLDKLAYALFRAHMDDSVPANVLAPASAEMRESIKGIAQQMPFSLWETIERYFLFTALGFVITEKNATFFAAGDGTIIVNGAVYTLGPFPNNAPPYLAHGITQATSPERAAKFDLKVVRQLPTAELQHFIVATDGIDDYLAAVAEGKNFPGKDKPVPPVSSFWTDDKYFRNPDNLRRTLAMANLDRHPALLRDDTTLIVGRRSAQVTATSSDASTTQEGGTP